MLFSKQLSLATLGWPMLTLGNSDLSKVFNIAGDGEQGACIDVQRRALGSMFTEMRKTAQFTNLQFSADFLESNFNPKQRLASSFGLAQKGASQESNPDILYKQPRELLGAMTSFLFPDPDASSNDGEKPLLWCNSLPMIWQKPEDSTTQLKGVPRHHGQTIAELLARYININVDAITNDWWIFTITRSPSEALAEGSTMFVIISKTAVPGVNLNGGEQPFPNGEEAPYGPYPCNHPTATSWSFQGFEILEGQTKPRRILILCPLFWQHRGRLVTTLGTANEPMGTNLNDMEPSWFDWYNCIFQMLFPLQTSNAPLISPKRPQIGPDLRQALSYNQKDNWELSESAQANAADQCMAVAMYDQAEPVKSLEELLAPKCPAVLTWFSIATFLTAKARYQIDWSTGVKSSPGICAVPAADATPRELRALAQSGCNFDADEL